MSKIKTKSYEESIKRIEELIGSIENETISVDELAIAVKEAVGLIKNCQATLTATQTEVNELLGGLTQGNQEPQE